MTSIRELSSPATALASAAWRAGGESVDFTPYQTSRPREDGMPDIDLAAVRQVVHHAMDEFTGRREQSDAWLAPRLHATLRLSRREAARPGLWRHLGLAVVPEYVRWRWGPTDEDKGDPAAPDRFHGPTYKHALGRLWWGAELFRNGSDYSPVEKAFGNQDLMNNFFRMDIAHHRPTTQAAVRVLFPEDGTKRGGREANALAKAVNAAATTLLVDALAADPGLDVDVRRSWMQESVDALLVIDRRPIGPDDPRVPEDSVRVMTELLEQLFKEAPVRGKHRADDAGQPSGPAESAATA
ncbi:DUF6339 family protein [Geodermatophilus sp. SYSU D00525]